MPPEQLSREVEHEVVSGLSWAGKLSGRRERAAEAMLPLLRSLYRRCWEALPARAPEQKKWELQEALERSWFAVLKGGSDLRQVLYRFPCLIDSRSPRARDGTLPDQRNDEAIAKLRHKAGVGLAVLTDVMANATLILCEASNQKLLDGLSNCRKKRPPSSIATIVIDEVVQGQFKQTGESIAFTPGLPQFLHEFGVGFCAGGVVLDYPSPKDCTPARDLEMLFRAQVLSGDGCVVVVAVASSSPTDCQEKLEDVEEVFLRSASRDGFKVHRLGQYECDDFLYDMIFYFTAWTEFFDDALQRVIWVGGKLGWKAENIALEQARGLTRDDGVSYAGPPSVVGWTTSVEPARKRQRGGYAPPPVGPPPTVGQSAPEVESGGSSMSATALLSMVAGHWRDAEPGSVEQYIVAGRDVEKVSHRGTRHVMRGHLAVDAKRGRIYWGSSRRYYTVPRSRSSTVTWVDPEGGTWEWCQV